MILFFQCLGNAYLKQYCHELLSWCVSGNKHIIKIIQDIITYHLEETHCYSWHVLKKCPLPWLKSSKSPGRFVWCSKSLEWFGTCNFWKLSYFTWLWHVATLVFVQSQWKNSAKTPMQPMHDYLRGRNQHFLKKNHPSSSLLWDWYIRKKTKTLLLAFEPLSQTVRLPNVALFSDFRAQCSTLSSRKRTLTFCPSIFRLAPQRVDGASVRRWSARNSTQFYSVRTLTRKSILHTYLQK